LDVGISKAKPVTKEPESKKEAQRKNKSDSGIDKVKALEEEIKKLCTDMNTNHNARPCLHQDRPIQDLDHQELEDHHSHALNFNVSIVRKWIIPLCSVNILERIYLNDWFSSRDPTFITLTRK
jgi:hypothetical protein